MSSIVKMGEASVANPRGPGWGQAAAIVGASAGIGAILGAATSRPCETAGEQRMFCGPKQGAFLGGLGGASLAGLVGLGVAVFSEKHRNEGVKVAALGIGTVVATNIVGWILT